MFEYCARVGLDVHKEMIAVAVAVPGNQGYADACHNHLHQRVQVLASNCARALRLTMR